MAAIGRFERRPLIAVAVSGGPDSLALMILADRWARERNGTAWGLVVDHRLRPESAAEAKTVVGWLAARSIPHALLVWHEPKPTTRIQEAARDARYRLLAEWCTARGCLHLLTAHHRDDQAETYSIRRRAGSGSDGLAGMSAVRELVQVRLLRPLLRVPKARLVAFLDAERQPYISDPSNRNPAFERARLRLTVEEQPKTSAIDCELDANAKARIARERQLAALLARTLTLHPAGFAALDPAPLAAAGELGERALDRVLGVLGGAVYPLRRQRLTRLREALIETPTRAHTLGGCRFVAWRGRVLVLREPSRTAPPLALAPGMAGLWDKRFDVRLPIHAPAPIEIGALGSQGAINLDRNNLDKDNPLPRLLYPVLPAIWDKAGLAAVPHLGWRRATFDCAPSLVFRPKVPLFAAGFTVV